MKFKYVNRITDKHGNVRNYFRPPGGSPERLPDAFGSHDFVKEHGRLLREFQETRGVRERLGSPNAPELKSSKQVGFLPGSVASFAQLYRHSPEFKKLASGSQYIYGKALDYLCDRRGAGRLDDVTVEDIDEYTFTIESPPQADLQVQMIGALWEFARGSKDFKPRHRMNPTREAKKRYKRKDEDGYKVWPVEVQRAFLALANPLLALLFHLLRETGQRLGDVCNMKWSHYDPETRTILIEATEKTNNPVFVSVTDDLFEVLSKAPRHGEFIISKRNGKPLKKDAASHRVSRTLASIGYNGIYCAHGLRKTLASEMALAGASLKAMKAQLGHKTDRMALFYSRQAENRLLAKQAGEAVNAARRRKAAVQQDDVIDFSTIRKAV